MDQDILRRLALLNGKPVVLIIPPGVVTRDGDRIYGIFTLWVQKMDQGESVGTPKWHCVQPPGKKAWCFNNLGVAKVEDNTIYCTSEGHFTRMNGVVEVQ